MCLHGINLSCSFQSLELRVLGNLSKVKTVRTFLKGRCLIFPIIRVIMVREEFNVLQILMTKV